MTWRKKAVEMYRALPADEKPRWKLWAQRLTSEYGETVSHDAVRGVCLRAVRCDSVGGEVKTVIEAVAKREGQTADLGAIIDTEKQKLIDKAERERLNKAIKEMAQRDVLADKMVAAVQALPPIKITPIIVSRKYSYREEVVVLQISDIQYGTFISAESTNGLNSYCSEMVAIQFDRLLNSIISITTKMKQLTPIKKLVIQFLGDNVEGGDIFIGQAYHIDQNAVDQVFGLSQLIAKFLIQLLNVFEEIECYCIGGNHGRIGDKGENPHHVSFDYILYRHLQAYMQNYKQIKWNITKSWWIMHDILGWRFLLLHGDDIKGWNGIPHYGIDRADARYTMLMAAKKQALYHYFCLGHFHTASMDDRPNGEKLVNGCWPGGSILALKSLVTSSRPSQNMFGVHEEWGISWRYKLSLEVG